MKKSFTYLIISFLMLSFFSRGQESIVHKSHAQRLPYLMENFYNNKTLRQDSTGFFKRVNELKKLARKEKDNELYYETLYLKLNYLSSRNYKNYLSEAKQLMKIADKERLLYLQIRIRQAIGFHYYFERKNYGEALFWFLNSYSYLRMIDESVFPEKQEAISNIANICYTMEYPNKALAFLKLAEKYSYKHTSLLSLNILNTKALAYRKLKKNDDSEQIFKKLITEASEKNVEIWKLIASINLAELYYEKKFYKTAIETLSGVFDIDTVEFRSEFLSRKILLAESYLALNDINSFKLAVNSLSKYQIDTNDLKLQKRIFYLFFKHQELNGNLKAALKFADSSIKMQNKLNYLEQQSSIKLAVDRDDYRQISQKEKELKENKIRNKRKMFLVSLIGILTLFIAFMLFRKEFKKQKLSIQIKDRQLSQKDIELATAKTYLENFKEENTQKDKLISDIVHKASNSENALSTRSIFTDVDWIEFKKEFSTVYPLFFDNLQGVNSTITPALERIAALISLGLGNSQMATLLGISTDSVARSKRRLKEKLPLAKDDLESYLKELTSYKNTPISFISGENFVI